MKTTRVLLGTPDGLQSNVEVVGHVSDPVDTLVAMTRTRPDVWIHSWQEGAELQALLSHVYDFDSSISVIRIDPNDPAGYVQVPLNSMASLMNVVRQGRQLAKAG